MGMFKDMRDLSKAGKQAKKEKGGSFKMMKDGLAQANEAVQQVQSDQALAERLANEGVDATATIQQMVATGKQVNMQPELQFQLTVDVNGSTSDVTHTQVVSPAVIGQLQPGAQVPVKVDPSDHTQLMIGLAG
jgi:primase-polymerase (primpol)-like protein